MKARKLRDIKFAVNSVVLNILFVCLKLPLALAYVKSSKPFETHTVYAVGAAFLFYLNFSVSFCVHLVSNAIFRREVVRIAKNLKYSNSDSDRT